MNLEDFLCNIRENLYKLQLIQTNDKRLQDVINSILSGKSLLESLVPYDFMNILISDSIESIELLGNMLLTQNKLKKYFMVHMFYPVFLNICLVFQVLFLKFFMQITINFYLLIMSFMFNVLVSVYIFYKIFKKIEFIKRLFMWINVIKGKISMNCLEKINISITNHSSIETISFQYFKCNGLVDLQLMYDRENVNLMENFTNAIKVITSISIMIIGVNLMFIFTRIQSTFN